ncbi:MAG: hypothetical protein MUE41_05200 [Gemmatimonadaceae bacterium]|jgi:membrane protein YqaA with SNARE-associated domain|nr:hypothetical protein [Gemmatimonadaceae bacterium]
MPRPADVAAPRVAGEEVPLRADGRGARLLAWLHAQAERGWSGSVILAWGVLQGSVVPGPADVVYAPLAAAHASRAVRFALLAALGSTIGGVIAYAIGTQVGVMDDGGVVSRALARLGIDAVALEPWRARTIAWGWALVLLATVSPLSTKLVCVAAGAFGVAPISFLAALAAGRTARTLSIAWLASRVGRAVSGGDSAGEEALPASAHADDREGQQRHEHEGGRDR